MANDAQGQQKAIAYLGDLIASSLRTGQPRLPTVKELARGAGVAPVTMWKAVRRLTAQGTLRAARRSGINVLAGGKSPQGETKRAPEELGRETGGGTARELEHDILRGVYRQAEVLPSLKQLSARYGASYLRLKRAMDKLIGRGHICVYRRGYRVSETGRPASSSTVVLVAHAHSASGPILFDRITQEYLQALESECARRGTGLTIVPCWYEGQDMRASAALDRLGTPGQRKAVLGAIVWATGMPELFLDRRILPVLLGLGRPIAWLDETGSLQLPSAAAGHRCVVVFSAPGACEVGRQAGRYLLSLGHRRIVYLSPFHRMFWSHERLRGLREVFGEAGYGDGVEEVTAGDVGPAADRSSLRRWLRLSPQAPAGPQQRLPESRTLLLDSMVTQTEERTALARAMRPLLRRALARRGVTAWAACNDAVGVECVAFLHAHGIRVPDDISVVGFDDSPEASFQRLTSYNFARPAIVYAMLSYILNPAWHTGRSLQDRMVHIQGFMDERESASRAAASPPGAPDTTATTAHAAVSSTARAASQHSATPSLHHSLPYRISTSRAT